MKILSKLFALSVLIVYLQSCESSQKELININEVSAWCIIGFDSLDRSPSQRIALLNEMGLKKYGYNRGKGEYGQLKEEFRLAKDNDIEVTSVFVWLNAKNDSVGHLSDSNEELLSHLKDVEQKPAIWVSFNNNFFENLDDKEATKVAVEMIEYVNSRAEDLGCNVALYNHTGWFGNPQNQVEIIKEMDHDNISIVYNFHHAHNDAEKYRKNFELLMPYLSFVNLNGVKKDGPKILDIGKGDFEYDMIKYLKEKGYGGPWGILGHVKTEDVKVVLERNIKGLKLLNARYNE